MITFDETNKVCITCKDRLACITNEYPPCQPRGYAGYTGVQGPTGVTGYTGYTGITIQGVTHEI